MVKKVFALASVTALTGLVAIVTGAGCSSEENPLEPSDASTDARSDRTAPNPDNPDPEQDAAPDAGSCASKTPIDATKYPYTTALKSPGACTTTELGAISSFFKTKVDADEDVLVSEWSQEVSDACAKCVFSDGEGAGWTPILVKDDKLDNVNRGGCVEIVSGKEACGRTYQQITECRLEACTTGSCKTQDEFTACLSDAQTLFGPDGPCEKAFKDMSDACGSSLGTYETACKGTSWTFEGPIKVQCIGTTKADAGDGG